MNKVICPICHEPIKPGERTMIAKGSPSSKDKKDHLCHFQCECVVQLSYDKYVPYGFPFVNQKPETVRLNLSSTSLIQWKAGRQTVLACL